MAANPWPNVVKLTKGDPARSLTVAYALALTLIAALSIGVHLLFEHIVREQRGDAQIINVAGRQRMLSQAVARLAEEFGTTGSSETRRKLLDLLDEIARVHAGLSVGVLASGERIALSDELMQILDGGPHELKFRMTLFLDAGRHLAYAGPAADAPDADLAAIRTAASGPLLAALESFVVQLERESRGRVDSLNLAHRAVLAGILLTLCLEAAFIFRPMVNRLDRYSKTLLHCANTDSLTGLFNRRAMRDSLDQTLSMAHRHDRQLSVLLLDIDNFKRVNDRYGHETGDKALIHCARIIESEIRAEDKPGRWGGEEFLVLLPETGAAGAYAIAERIRKAIERESLSVAGATIALTVSIGVAALDGQMCDAGALVAAADRALYRCKAEGRNRSLLSEETQPQGALLSTI